MQNLSFQFGFDPSSGGNETAFPVDGFAVRKMEAFVWPTDNITYAYADIINYTDYYYPDSYSSEVGVFSSPNGRTDWQYHGIVVHRGPFPGWDGGGIASPGAAAAPDGTVLLGFVGENEKSGGA